MTQPEKGLSLILPLLALPRETIEDQPPYAGSVGEWSKRITEAQETCLLLDGRGRVVTLSVGCALMLNVSTAAAVGRPLRDLVVLVDFTATGLPVEDPEVHLPPLKALRSCAMARGLVRLRLAADVVATYDVIGVPLAGGVGALGFFAEV